jgi:hypothetical protein
MGILGALADKTRRCCCFSRTMLVRSAKPRSLDLERDLPPAGWRRWGALNKAAVVIAVRSGRLGRLEAYDRYMLSDEELSAWEDAFDQDGIAGLLVKRR